MSKRKEVKDLKREAFAQEYVKTLNATKAMQKINPGIKDNTAKNEGYRMMTKEDTRERIMQIMRDKGLDEELINKRLKHWIEQDRSPSTSLGAIQEANKILDIYPKSIDIHMHAHKNLSDDELKERINELIKELKGLKGA